MSNFSSFAQNHHRCHDRFILVAIFLLFGVTFRTNSYVSCARSSSSSSSPGVSSESAGATGGSSSSLGSSSSSSTRERERELISAQFRAAQDSRDLDPISETDTLTAAAAAASLAEEEALAKYMAASASAYSPSKLRMNKYSQTGFYDPYPSYAAAFSNVPSSYYPFNGYTSYKDNPMIDTYPYYERDRLREIQTRAMSQLSPASYSSSNGGSSSSSSSSNRDGFGSNFFGGGGGGGYREGFRSSDQDSSAMSSGHGHDDHHGHGSGHGHGWGHTNHYTSKVNTNAIGLLGLLGLLSLLSNVLLLFTTTTTTTTAAARIKRRAAAGNIDQVLDETQEERRQRIFMEILPHLTPVAHARDGVLPVECTFHGVCMANKILVNELGVHGRSAGTRISSAIVKLLDKVIPVKKASSKSKGKSEIRKKLESAGLQGRNKENCEKKYPVCKALRKQSAPSLPFVITMQDLPKLISKVSKLSQNGFNVPMNL